MTTLAFNLSSPDQIAHDLQQMNRRLAKEHEIPADIRSRVAELADDIANTHGDELALVPLTSWVAIQSAAMRAQSTLLHHEHNERAARRQMRLLLEELRSRFARLAEREPVSEEQPVRDVLIWLDRHWAIPQERKADLIGTSKRSYQRWLSETEATTPGPEEERNIRRIARLVNELRHVLTSAGVADWLTTTNAALGGRTPAEVLTGEQADADAITAVYTQAAQARSGTYV